MKLRPLHHALLIALLGAAPVALAQTSGATGGSEPATTSAMPSGAQDATASHAARHRTHAHARNATTSRETSGNPEYEAALRRCVQMSGDERERCLDDAIARYAS